MAEQLFWQVMNHLGEQSPGFVAGRSRGTAFRFKIMCSSIPAPG